MDPRLGSDQQTAIFCALNRVSPDGKTGYYYYILLWVDKQAPKHAGEKNWTESASKEHLAAFARKKTRGYPDSRRVSALSTSAVVDVGPTARARRTERPPGAWTLGFTILI